jgi:hypothetical protein
MVGEQSSEQEKVHIRSSERVVIKRAVTTSKLIAFISKFIKRAACMFIMNHMVARAMSRAGARFLLNDNDK